MADLRRDSLALARRCADILDERKLKDIAVFDVRGSLQITDYFVIASALNRRHARAASDYLDKELRAEGVRRRGMEGYRDGKWVLLDLVDVVVHLFLVEQREYYDLELLWGDCPKAEWRPSRAAREA